MIFSVFTMSGKTMTNHLSPALPQYLLQEQYKNQKSSRKGDSQAPVSLSLWLCIFGQAIHDVPGLASSSAE